MDVGVIYKKTKYHRLMDDSSEESRTFLNTESPELLDIIEGHAIQQFCTHTILEMIEKSGVKYEHCLREDIDFCSLNKKDYIIVIGGDGTVLDVSHHVTDTPILAVNSDTRPVKGSVGYFAWADINNFEKMFNDIQKQGQTKLNRLEAVLNEKTLSTLALNDIALLPAETGSTCQYCINVGGKSTMPKKNYGMIMSTAAGSTAWIYDCGGKVMPLDSNQIEYHAMCCRGFGYNFTDGDIKLRVKSPRAKLCIDGVENSHPLAITDEVLVRRGHPLTLVGDLKTKQREYK